MYRRIGKNLEGYARLLNQAQSRAKDSLLARRTLLLVARFLQSAIVCSLLLSGLIAEAHEAVVRHHPHAAESRKPHETESRHPHAAASHPKPQKPSKHQTASHAKPQKVAKH